MVLTLSTDLKLYCFSGADIRARKLEFERLYPKIGLDFLWLFEWPQLIVMRTLAVPRKETKSGYLPNPGELGSSSRFAFDVLFNLEA